MTQAWLTSGLAPDAREKVMRLLSGVAPDPEADRKAEIDSNREAFAGLMGMAAKGLR